MNRAWIRATFVGAFVFSAVAANASLLFDNGPLITNAGAHTPDGADVSLLQNVSLDLASYGLILDLDFSGAPIWGADDFTIGAGNSWSLSGMEFYGYERNSGLTPTITGVNLKIYKDPSNPGDPTTGTLVFGDDGTNRMTGIAFSNIYRLSENDGMGDTVRPIMTAKADFSTVLGPGHYFAVWHFSGSANLSGPWAPPVTTLGQFGKAGANAVYFHDEQWEPFEDLGTLDPQDLAFKVYGSTVPEPATLLALAGGALGLLARRRRK